MPPGTQIARLGGDEFAIIVPESVSNGAKDPCTIIQQALTAPFDCEGHRVVVSSSMGVAHYPKHSEDAEQLLMMADTAMHRAKGEGANNVSIFHASMHAHFKEHLELESELNGAIERGEMTLHYQPKIDLRDWKVVGLEALIRWRHRERGWIPPGEFIRIAEETGQIIELGRWLLNEACRQISAWRNTRMAPLQVAINISSLQFTHDDLQRSIMEAVWANTVMPRMLELEITESVMVSNIDRTIEVLSALRNTGISVSIDDFGTGYSSLSYLKRFPLDKLKIDRSFISDLHQNADDAAICSAIVAMGHQLGLTVVAEGVENEAQLNFLNDRGCDQLQGFYIGKPMPAEELAGYFQETLDPLLERRRRNRPAAL
jgi:predicted signal transduction protein with EAL and GGDEF domain